jgi:hypothetical protein
MAIIKKYSDYIILLLVILLLILLLIIVTDIHVAKINRDIRQSVQSTASGNSHTPGKLDLVNKQIKNF